MLRECIQRSRELRRAAEELRSCVLEIRQQTNRQLKASRGILEARWCLPPLRSEEARPKQPKKSASKATQTAQLADVPPSSLILPANSPQTLQLLLPL